MVFEWTIKYLEENQSDNWTIRYILLLWSSVLLLVPFSFQKLPSPIHPSRILEKALRMLELSGAERVAAVYFVATFIKRGDEYKVDKFVEWASRSIVSIGVLECLCLLAKGIDLTDMNIQSIIVLVNEQSGISDTLMQKLRLKLARRLVVFQQERSADHIEKVLKEHLNGLLHKDTVVRWSAAKGVALIAKKFNGIRDDVCKFIFKVMRSAQNDPLQLPNHFHGCCLALGELVKMRLVRDYDLLTEWIFYVQKSLVLFNYR